MAGAAPAYRYSARSQAQPRRSDARRDARADVRVLHAGASRGVSASTFQAVKVILAIVAVFAVVGCIRIALVAATVNTLVSEENITEQAEQVTSATNSLEVSQVALTTPATVKTYAEENLDMGTPWTTETITLSPDVVCTDAEGNLSLSRSLAVAVQG